MTDGETDDATQSTLAALRAMEPAAVLAEIDGLVAASAIDAGLTAIIRADLEQARRAFAAEAYKAFVVMLGAALEGIMLGVLRQPAVLNRLVADPELPNKLWKRLGGQRHSRNAEPVALARRLGPDLGFADYEAIALVYLPHLATLQIEPILSFEAAIHPWKTMATPQPYAPLDRPRALSFLHSLHILAAQLTQLGAEG
ncbi:MAG TPA: hypothetical protein VGE07_02710 [Herpetosiphonaceae bacterium]